MQSRWTRFEPNKVPIGGLVAVSFTLRSIARAAQDLLVDLRVHFVTANGNGSPKVFKLKRASRADGSSLPRRCPWPSAHTTGKPRPGRHDIEVFVNGEAIRAGSFEVVGAGRVGKK
jgi:hypothetical protein